MTIAADEPLIVPDTQYHGLLGLLPAAWSPYIQLARIDRPIGSWLLYWPGTWAILLAGGGKSHWPLLLWFALGSWAMRGAGCVYNDIVDRDLDRMVARTRARPVASGRVSLKAAWAWLLILCAIGLVVLVQLRWEAQLVALASLGLVAGYPFMKRITWWPQAWLGLVFAWALPTGWVAVTGTIHPAMLWLYGGAMAWVIGYDTIYALQDREDDALVGIRSSALRLGNHARAGIGGFYLVAILCWTIAFWQMRPQVIALLPLLPVASHLAWQALTLETSPSNAKTGENALARFRSNRFAGLLMALACGVLGSTA